MQNLFETQRERMNEGRAERRAVRDMIRSLLAQVLPPRSHARSLQSDRRSSWALKALYQQIRIVYELGCLRPVALPGECYHTPSAFTFHLLSTSRYLLPSDTR
jgi:hypothetical protein